VACRCWFCVRDSRSSSTFTVSLSLYSVSV
jgi:hypothetical protein